MHRGYLKCIFFLWLTCCLHALQAQIVPYQLGVGGSGSLSFFRAGDPLGARGNLDLQAWFVPLKSFPNLGMGVEGGAGASTQDGPLSWYVGPHLRCYLVNQPDRWLPYVFGSGLYAWRELDRLILNQGPPRIERTEYQGIELDAGLGLARFIGPSALVEIKLSANYGWGLQGSPNTSFTPALEIGLQVLLPALNQWRIFEIFEK